jgi:TetR/AcrR family acrAB operon transcriptional repressor
MSSAVRTKKDEQSEATRRRLVDAAALLFAERGFRQTSVQAIGEQAGISRGSIFWHFGSKEGLLWAVVEDAFARWESDVLVPDIGDAVGIEAVRRGIASHRRFLTEDTEALRLFYVLMFEAMGPRAELRGRFVDLHRHLREATAGWIAAGQAAGELREDIDPQSIITVLVGALGGLAYQYLLDPDDVDLDAAYGGLTALFERGLAAERTRAQRRSVSL